MKDVGVTDVQGVENSVRSEIEIEKVGQSLENGHFKAKESKEKVLTRNQVDEVVVEQSFQKDQELGEVEARDRKKYLQNESNHKVVLDVKDQEIIGGIDSDDDDDVLMTTMGRKDYVSSKIP